MAAVRPATSPADRSGGDPQGMIGGRIAAPLRGAAEPWYNEPNDHRSGPSAARCRR